MLKNDSRFLYQAINNRNIIVTSLIDIIISKDNYEEGDFLLLPSKPKFGLKIMGYNKDELDVSYEQSIQLNLIKVAINLFYIQYEKFGTTNKYCKIKK